MHTLLKTQRKAIAMIELIFAIVIMGIVMLTVPLMISTTAQSTNVAFQQESIAIIASHANTLMTYAWDEKNTNSYSVDVGDLTHNVLTVSNGDSDLNTSNRLSLSKYERQPDANVSSLSTIFGTQDGNGSIFGLTAELIKDDIDDFHDTSTSLKIANGIATTALSYEDDYMDINITLDTDIAYFSDTPSSTYAACQTGGGCAFSRLFDDSEKQNPSSNIKRIKVTLTSGNVLDKKIILRSFMCNIGAANPKQESGF
jgi:Tfp pilus assembly protein PilV